VLAGRASKAPASSGIASTSAYFASVQALTQAGGEVRVGATALDHGLDDAVEDFERPLRGVVAALAAQHPGAGLDARAVELGQQAALAAAGDRLDRHEARAAVRGAPQLRLERVEVGRAGDEGGLGEAAPAALAQADHDLRILVAAVQRVADRAEVVPHRLGGLVAVLRVLAQQALHEVVERRRHVGAQRAQRRRAARRVPAQDLADRFADEGRAPRQALEQHDAGRVQVRTLVDLLVQQARLLQRDVVGGVDGQLRRRRPRAERDLEAEVDERHAPQRGGGGHDDVCGLDVAVQHATLVGGDQPADDAARDADGVPRRQRAPGDARAQRDALDVGPHDERLVAPPAGSQRRREHRRVDVVQHAHLVFEAQPGGVADPRAGRDLDDDVGPRSAVLAAPGRDAAFAPEQLRRAIATVVQAVAGDGGGHCVSAESSMMSPFLFRDAMHRISHSTACGGRFLTLRARLDGYALP